MRRPGVFVSIGSVGATQPAELTPYTYMPVGYAPWGPVNKPVALGSLSDAVRVYGSADGLAGYQLPLALEHYFSVAGPNGRVLAVRGFNAGSNPLDNYTAKATIKDEANNGLLVIKAAWPGALGNSFKVDIAQGRQSGEFLFVLWGRGLPESFYWRTGAGAEADMRALIEAWNKAADSLGSDFRLELPLVTGVPTFNPANPDPTKVLPKIPVRPSSLATALSGGSDGGAMAEGPLIGGVDASGAPYGLETLADSIYGPGIVDIYGFSSQNVAAALDTHAATYRRMALRQIVDPGTAQAADVIAAKATVGGSSYSADYWPWVFDLKGRLAPLTAFAAGLGALKISRLDSQGGIKASWTGELPISGIETVGGREVVTDQAAELLFEKSVNWVRRVRGRGYRLEAQKLAVPDGQTSRISHRITLNTLAYGIEEIAQQFRDQVIPATGATQQAIAGAIKDYLAPYEAGKPAPQGDTIFGSAVVVDRTTIQDLQQEILRVGVEVALSPHAERVQVGITHIPIR